MRIIAGEAKGRRLATPRTGTRPFTGRAKEAVFSSLADRIPGANVLDLFAGSGSLGLEALSRGAAKVVFVERDRNAVRILEENVASVGLGGRIVRSDAAAFVSRDGGTYDLVFVDPPFAMTDAEVDRLLTLVGRRLAVGGTAVLHRRRGGSVPESDNLQTAGPRRYGDSAIWFLVKEQR
jgi:16S rRNA (guanine966-N2)-methyltransferase